MGKALDTARRRLCEAPPPWLRRVAQRAPASERGSIAAMARGTPEMTGGGRDGPGREYGGRALRKQTALYGVRDALSSCRVVWVGFWSSVGRNFARSDSMCLINSHISPGRWIGCCPIHALHSGICTWSPAARDGGRQRVAEAAVAPGCPPTGAAQASAGQRQLRSLLHLRATQCPAIS
jgi:hypothetical protein